MNAETAKQHLSREADQQPHLTDMPVSGRSEPRPVPLPAEQHIMIVRGLENGQVKVTCSCHEGDHLWSRTFEPFHPLDDLIELKRQHCGPLTEGPGQPGENEGEPDSGVGPGPVTDFSSPSSPLEACFACGAPNQVFIGVAEVLPDGSTGSVHLYCRDITPCNDRRDAQLLSFGGRDAEALFGDETNPGGA